MTEDDWKKVSLPIQVRVGNVLRSWIREHWSDFTPALIQSLKSFIDNSLRLDSNQSLVKSITTALNSKVCIIIIYLLIFLFVFIIKLECTASTRRRNRWGKGEIISNTTTWTQSPQNNLFTLFKCSLRCWWGRNCPPTHFSWFWSICIHQGIYLFYPKIQTKYDSYNNIGIRIS